MDVPTLDSPPERGVGSRPKEKEVLLAALATLILVFVLYVYWYIREETRDHLPLPQTEE